MSAIEPYHTKRSFNGKGVESRRRDFKLKTSCARYVASRLVYSTADADALGPRKVGVGPVTDRSEVLLILSGHERECDEAAGQNHCRTDDTDRQRCR